MTPTITEANIFAQLGTFLQAVLPPAVNVIKGQVNRTPEPANSDYTVMWMLRRPRLATNIDTSADVKFTGSITGAVLTVTAVTTGTIVDGATIFGTGVAANTTIVDQISGATGEDGTYTVSVSQTLGPLTLSSGATLVEQDTQIAIQIDVHGPNSGDNAQVISTLMRDAYATYQFANQAQNYGVVPLYADDPRQVPFINDQSQYEERWVVEAMLQAHPVVSIPQQYANSVEIDVVSVDATYPPS